MYNKFVYTTYVAHRLVYDSRENALRTDGRTNLYRVAYSQLKISDKNQLVLIYQWQLATRPPKYPREPEAENT